MKVMLIYPQFEGRGDIPIGLTILSAALRSHGHSVTVFDCSDYTPDNNLQVRQENIGMFKAAPAPPVPRPAPRDIKLLEADLINRMKEFKVEMVGITATSGTYPLGLKCSRIIKKNSPGIKIIFGGIHPTICSEEVIKEDSVDAVCIGEGEDALVEFCQACENKKPADKIGNLWVKDAKNKNVVYRNPLRKFKDLDQLPLQDFSDFNEYDLYRPLGGKIYRMLNAEISRGCIFKCNYCSNHFLQGLFKDCGNYHRRKSPELAAKQLKQLKDKYDFNAIRFWDEDFTVFPVAYLRELAKFYKKHVDLPFVIYAGTRTVTQEKVNLLKEMGCITLAMAIESGNYWIRKYVLNRDISDEDIIKKYEIVKKSGIRVSAYNMIGLPFETREMVFDTINLNRRVMPQASSVAPFIPYPKTRLSELTREFGLLKKALDYDSLKTSLDTPHLNKEQIDGLVRTFAFYVKLPEKFHPVLRRCEESESFSRKAFPGLLKYLRDNNEE